MYTSINFKTKKQLKNAVLAGCKIDVFQPGLGEVPTNGMVYLEGPWYPQAHTWYASAELKNGFIIKVK